VLEAAFLLLMFVDDKKVSPEWYFRDVNDCVYIAVILKKQGPNRITSWCQPVNVPKGTKIYD